MSTITTTTRHTPEDLLRMPDGKRYELVDGNLVEMNVSLWSSYVAGELYRRLGNHCRDHRLGWVLPEGTSYQCFPDTPNKVRRADTSFIGYERLTPEQAAEEGHVPIAPDLAAEVVSPNDRYYEVDTKVNEWLEAGVRLLWVVNPATRQVRVYRADGSEATVRENEELSGENVVTGFRCRAGDLFQPPPGPAPASA
jgi:Uma2 family endonuclease